MSCLPHLLNPPPAVPPSTTETRLDEEELGLHDDAAKAPAGEAAAVAAPAPAPAAADAAAPAAAAAAAEAGTADAGATDKIAARVARFGKVEPGAAKVAGSKQAAKEAAPAAAAVSSKTKVAPVVLTDADLEKLIARSKKFGSTTPQAERAMAELKRRQRAARFGVEYKPASIEEPAPAVAGQKRKADKKSKPEAGKKQTNAAKPAKPGKKQQVPAQGKQAAKGGKAPVQAAAGGKKKARKA